MGPAVVEEMDEEIVKWTKMRFCQSEERDCLLCRFRITAIRGSILCLTVDPIWPLVCSGLTSVRVELSLDFCLRETTDRRAGI